MDFVIHHSYLIPLLPLVGAAAAGLFGGSHLRHNSHWPIWLGVGTSAVLSFVLLFGMLGRWHPGHEAGHGEGQNEPAAAHAAAPAEAGAENETTAGINAEAEARLAAIPTIAQSRTFFTWIRAGSFRADAGFFFDP